MATIKLKTPPSPPPVSNAGEAWAYYNDSTKEVLLSIDGGAYLPLGTGGGGGGDMFKATYDPTNVNGDAFSMGNMAETASAKILTSAERTEILKLSGITPDDSSAARPPLAHTHLKAHITDLSTFTTGDSGLVPAPGAVSGLYLKDDGTWDSPAGGSGEVNLGANVGTGAGNVFRDKTGVTLNFKRLAAGAGISIGDGANEITISSATAAGPVQYMSGNARIIASGVGVSYVSAGGIGTITIPAGVVLSSVQITGTAAELSGGAFTIRIVDNGGTYNQSEATALHPQIRYVDRAAILIPPSPTSVAPYPQRPIGGGFPTIQCEGLNGVGSAPANGVDWVVGAMPSNDWTLLCSF